MAIGLSAVTDATKTDHRKVRNLLAIRRVNNTVTRKKTAFMDFEQL
jgi:ribosomal protein L30/L7E